jgi:hypothetical protein
MKQTANGSDATKQEFKTISPYGFQMMSGVL